MLNVYRIERQYTSYRFYPEGRIISEPLPKVHVNHEMFFDNYYRFVQGEEELAVKPNQIFFLMKVLDAIRVSAETKQVVALA